MVKLSVSSRWVCVTQALENAGCERLRTQCCVLSLFSRHPVCVNKLNTVGQLLNVLPISFANQTKHSRAAGTEMNCIISSEQ